MKQKNSRGGQKHSQWGPHLYFALRFPRNICPPLAEILNSRLGIQYLVYMDIRYSGYPVFCLHGYQIQRVSSIWSTWISGTGDIQYTSSTWISGIEGIQYIRSTWISGKSEGIQYLVYMDIRYGGYPVYKVLHGYQVQRVSSIWSTWISGTGGIQYT